MYYDIRIYYNVQEHTIIDYASVGLSGSDNCWSFPVGRVPAKGEAVH